VADSVFAIDLGTTYSCIAHVDEYGLPAVILNKDSEPTTPSVVLFESETSHVVGRQAKRYAEVKPDEVCKLVKRQMGDASWSFDAHGKEWSAAQVSSFILGAVADDARRVTGAEVKKVVITVPAYFGDDQRIATKLAGKLAGLEVVDIINEPMAAAFSYGFAQAEAGNDETVLVYDLGGGTFDTTVIQIAEKAISTVATDGYHELGGANWDEELARHVARCFTDEHPDAEDPLDDKHAYQKLMEDVEANKRALTERESVDFILAHDGERSIIPVTREQFEEITSGLLEQTIDKVRGVLDAARKEGVSKIDRILLVGGMSKMPVVKRRLEGDFGFPAELKDPDLAVAKGAALYGRKKLIEGKVWDIFEREGHAQAGGERDLSKVDEKAKLPAVEATAEDMGISSDEAMILTDITLKNVCSHGFGIAVLKRQPNGEVTKEVDFLCHQNEKLPLEKPRTYGTPWDNQPTIRIEVFEQGGSAESERPEDNKLIVDGDITGIPPGYPQGTEIPVVLRMGTDGIIQVSAFHPAKQDEPLTLKYHTGGEQPENLAEEQLLVASTTRRD
jgi:molecular chaperone DnaK